MDPLVFDSLTGLLGLVLLYGGAELLVRGSSELGLRMKLSPVIVGLTIVSLATSMPELVVSLQAVAKGSGDLAIGNVVGSNLANIGLILGVSALIAPLAVDRFSVRIDAPVMLGFSLLGAFFLWDRRMGAWEGAIMLVLIVAYLVFRVRLARRDTAAAAAAAGEVPAVPSWSVLRAVLAVLLGLGLLVIGGDWLVRSGLSVAERLGVPEAFIALSMVAIGTSLPELATSVVAAARGQAEIAVGNVLGSNIFNLAGVLGVSSLVSPLTSGDFAFELVMMIAFAVLLLPLARSGFRIVRWEGALLLVAYLGVLVWAA